jgi:phosphate starvation-inducible protein PhoH and related proteins
MPMPQSAELFFGLRLTEEQVLYGNSICDNLFTGVQARAGSGKTTVAIGVGKLMNKPVHYIFPTVQEKALGYTTGDQRAKESKYLTPLIDALIAIGENPIQAIISDDPKQQKKSAGWVHAYSHNYMRGGNIKDSLVIIDEGQNLTKAEIRTILTRIHDSCHVVLAGDKNQCDIDPKKSGFIPYLDHYNKTSFSQICELTKNFRGVISAHAETL